MPLWRDLDGVMRPNDAGRMVERWWLELNHKYPTVETDEHSVMPNHFHGVILICGQPDAPGQPHEWGQLDAPGQPHEWGQLDAPGQPHEWGQLDAPGQPHRVAPTAADDDVGAALRGRPVPATPPAIVTAPTLGDIMGWFKTMMTNEYIRGVKTLGWPPFDRRVATELLRTHHPVGGGIGSHPDVYRQQPAEMGAGHGKPAGADARQTGGNMAPLTAEQRLPAGWRWVRLGGCHPRSSGRFCLRPSRCRRHRPTADEQPRHSGEFRLG